jgi:hypothetical protein
MAQTIQSSDLGNDQQNQLNQQSQGNQQQAGQGGATPTSGSTGSTGNGTSGGNKSASGAENQAPGGYQQQTGQPQQQSTVTSYNPNTQQGSGYTNIQSVLNANKNNQLGQTVGSGIQGQTNQAQQNLNQSQQQFNQQTAANQANTQGNSQLVQNVLGNTAQYAPGGANQSQGQQFQQLMSGQYAGPTQLTNAQQIQNQAQNVKQLGQATGSQAGQIGLLQQFVGSPQYTQGQQSLDQLLLGQTGQPQLANARRSALQLQGQVGGALAGAQATGQQQQAQAANFGQNVQQQFGNTVAGINTGLQQQAQQQQAGANAAYQQAVSGIQSGNITPQQAALLGLTQGEQVTGNALQNVGQYLTQNPNQATAQNVASAQNYAQLDALRQLGGTYTPSAAQNVLQQYSGQDQNANQFQNQQQITGNTTGFNTANQGQIANYNSLVNPAQATLSAAQSNLAQLQAAGASANGGGSGPNIGNLIRQAEIGGYQQQVGNDQTAYNNALAAANAATGGLQTINITPQQAALQQIAQNQGNS